MTLPLFLLAMMATGIAAPAQAITPAEPCQPGPPEPSSSSNLRPHSTAICDYDLQEMYGRLESVISAPNAQLSAESVTSVFGLPPMTTGYDDARQASYTTVITGKDGWKMRLWVRESAYPLVDTLPPAFVPGVRPTRLVDIDKLDVRYDITITLPDGANEPGRCMTAADAAVLALASGRKDDTVRSSVEVTDFGPATPTFVGANGQRFSVSLSRQASTMPTEAEMKADCVTRVLFMQPPKNG